MTRRPDQRVRGTVRAGTGPAPSSGIVRATQVVVFGTGPGQSGIFVYNSAGNLIGAWVGQDTTDPLTSHVVTLGFTTEDPSGTLQAVFNPVALILRKLSGALAAPTITVVDQTLGGTTPQSSVISATAINTPLINAVQPGTASTPESFHSLTLTGWTGTFNYKLTAEGNVQLSWQLTAPAANVNNVTFATLPAGYRPTTTRTFPTAADSVTAATMGLLFVQSSGAIQANHIIANATNVSGEVQFPLGL